MNTPFRLSILLFLVIGGVAFCCASPEDEGTGPADSRDAGRDLSDTGHRDTAPVDDAGQDLTPPDLGTDPQLDIAPDPTVDPTTDPVTEPRPDTQADPQTEAETTVEPEPPGSACQCDSDCEDVDGHEGVCVFGVCMTRASADCSAGGSTEECGAGSVCWFISGYEDPLCWPTCTEYECAGTCAEDDVCEPAEGMNCDRACGSYCTGGELPTTGEPGSVCECDSDCHEVEGHQGVCVYGVCMTRASGECSSAGSATECATGSRCWNISGFEDPICWPDCASYECAGMCDDDGSCVPGYYQNCDQSCGSYCSGGGTADPGQPGAACTCDTDCPDVEGHQGVCVYGICMTLASAACSSAGSEAECAAGSRCWNLSGGEASICWPDCESYGCAGQCDADGSCVPGEGQDCDPACGTFCSGSSGPTGGYIGTACETDGDCLDGTCYPESADNGFIDGYCLQFDCATPSESCGNGGICVSGLASSNVCMQRCDSGCREGYACVYIESGGPTFCYPYCTGDLPCPSGYQCEDYTCIPGEACSTTYPNGFCPTGQTCVSGSCQDNCSTEHPSGYCPTGFTCQSGTCISTSGCGSWECTLGYEACHQLVRMPGADDNDFYNPSSADARAAGYYIATDPDYTYLRRDLTMVVQWAACEMRTRFQSVAPIGLSDMTQADGRTPGLDVGSARHPTGTHTGDDIDTAYYQTDGTNNPQIICGDGSDNNYNGYPGTYNDGYHCTTTTNIVDLQKEVWFLVYMAHHPSFRVVGIDTTLYTPFMNQIQSLHNSNLITDAVYNRVTNLGHESDLGWDFHHHHTHFSYND